MEKSLRLNETEDTPQVILDANANEFSLTGKSLPEDALEFYKPIIAWMREYIKQPNPTTEFHVKLQYFNSSSVKQVSDLLMMLEELIKAGKKANIFWFYEEGDELMEIKGQEFKGLLAVPLELKIY